jgi:hypothetical protein
MSEPTAAYRHAAASRSGTAKATRPEPTGIDPAGGMIGKSCLQQLSGFDYALGLITAGGSL